MKQRYTDENTQNLFHTGKKSSIVHTNGSCPTYGERSNWPKCLAALGISLTKSNDILRPFPLK